MQLTGGCWLVVLVSCVLPFASAVRVKKSYCYADDRNPYLNFGTKSSYEHHHSREQIKHPPGCKPVYFWLVSRHGTRWAESKDLDQFTELFKMRDMIIHNWNERRGEMCHKDIENLKTWTFDMVQEQGKTLTEQGQDDLFFLGRRFRLSFPELLDSSYDPKKYVVRHTNTVRTKQSAEYFYRGVFGLDYFSPAPELHGAISTEHLIYPYENCPKFDTVGPVVKKERMKFEKGDLVKEVVARVSRRLGFDNNLTYEDVKSIYDGCRYQKAWFVQDDSPWCAAFVFEDLEILEYNEDVRYYYRSGPGMPINIKLACPIVKDLIDRFTAYEKDPTSQPQGVFYMSHVNMVNMLTGRLGLIDQPEHLMAADYHKQKDRKYRTSEIMPFTGNVAAVLYSCADGLNVVFYMSERKVLYKGCDDGLCKLSYLRDVFKFTRDAACTDTSFCFEDKPAKPCKGKPATCGARPSGVLLAPPASALLVVAAAVASSVLLYFKHTI